MNYYSVLLLCYFYVGLLQAQYFVKDDEAAAYYKSVMHKGTILEDPSNDSYFLHIHGMKKR